MTSPPGLAVVTGASSGIGRSLAGVFAEHGFDVVLAADEPEVHDAAGELRRDGISVSAIETDLATREGVDALHRFALDQPADITALAVNAGTGVHGPFHQSPLEPDLRLADLNVRSAIHLAKLVLPGMVDRGHGRVLFTSSIAGLGPGPYHATYAASKAFLHSFSEALRHELKGTGVTTTSLMPGPTDTRFFERADMQETRVARGPKADPDKVARQAFEALMAGKDHVVSGSLVNNLMARGSALVPDRIAAALAAVETTPIDEEKR
jgi:short-subunit dehydrogenase